MFLLYINTNIKSDSIFSVISFIAHYFVQLMIKELYKNTNKVQCNN